MWFNGQENTHEVISMCYEHVQTWKFNEDVQCFHWNNVPFETNRGKDWLSWNFNIKSPVENTSMLKERVDNEIRKSTFDAVWNEMSIFGQNKQHNREQQQNFLLVIFTIGNKVQSKYRIKFWRLRDLIKRIVFLYFFKVLFWNYLRKCRCRSSMLK